MTKALHELRGAGLEAVYSRTLSPRSKYDVIIAHSGGTYQRWSKAQANRLFLVVPPWDKVGSFTVRELSRRARARHRDPDSRQSTLQTLRFLASLRSTLRHTRAVRSINLLGELSDWLGQDTARQIDLIVYERDLWTDGEIKTAFAVLPRTSITVLKGNHDDLGRQPANVIAHIIESLHKKDIGPNYGK